MFGRARRSGESVGKTEIHVCMIRTVSRDSSGLTWAAIGPEEKGPARNGLWICAKELQLTELIIDLKYQARPFEGRRRLFHWRRRPKMRYGWVLVFVAGVIDVVRALFLAAFPAPLDNPGVLSLTGLTWRAIQQQSPAAAKLTSYFIGQFGVQETFLGLLVMGLSATGLKKGDRWTWYLLWLAPLAFLAYAASNFSIGGSTWALAVVDAVLAVVGLVLSNRQSVHKHAGRELEETTPAAVSQ
jgi:hypothetical protein